MIPVEAWWWVYGDSLHCSLHFVFEKQNLNYSSIFYQNLGKEAQRVFLFNCRERKLLAWNSIAKEKAKEISLVIFL